MWLQRLIFCGFVGLCAMPAQARDLVVFAAASLKEPLDTIAAEVGGVVVSVAGSGTLARQITLGAPADVVILAHPDWMDVLDAGGHIAGESRIAIAGNQIVLAGHQASEVALTGEALTGRLGDGRLAIGNTRAVPAGIYGRAALEHLGLWADVQDKLAETDNVRAALALLIRGEVPLALVYESDLAVAPQAHVVARFGAQTHAPITYEAAIVATSNHPEAVAFLAALSGARGQSALRDAGFLPAPDQR